VFREVKASDVLHTFTSPMAREIFHRCLNNYWLVPVLFLSGIYSLIRQQKYLLVLLTSAFCLLYFMALCLTFQDFIPFYTESEWMPFSIISSAPFVFYTLPRLKPGIALVVIAGIFAVRMLYILCASEKFTQRKDYIFSILQKMEHEHFTKAIVHENDRNRKILLMNWGVPTESILASALQGDKPQKNFVVIQPSDSTSIPSDPHMLVIPFGMMHDSELNGKYFEIDTTAGYKVLGY
jgi:hypothetical protein